jgi:alanine dehydrogenase
MQTGILTRSEVARILTPAMAVKAVELAFTAHGMGQAEMPPKSYLTFPRGDMRSMPASLFGQGLQGAGIKCVTVHPENRSVGLPTVMAIVILINPENGTPLVVMDATHLTALRTGAAGALAAKLLAVPAARTAGFVGSGAQARAQLTCTMEVLRLEAVKIWQHARGSKSAEDFAHWAEEAFGLAASVHREVDEVTTGVDILVTTTPSREPIVRTVSPGTHINAIGADAKGKQEIGTDLVKKCTIIVDDWAQASHSGEINVPISEGAILKEDVHGQLGEIAAGKKPGRTGKGEITLFDSTGLAIQDVACALLVHKALGEMTTTQTLDFLA